MPLDLIFVTPGNYTIDDDGIAGNNTSVIRDGTGAAIFTFVHPVDSLSFVANTPGVNVTINFSDSLGAADFRIGVLDDPAQSLDSIVVRNVRTTGDVTLVSNGSITEGGSDAAADIVAGTLVLSAQTGIGTGANAIETQVGILEGETLTGGINLRNAGTVQIGGISDLVDGLNVETSGDLTFTNTGSIFLSDVDLDTGNPPPAPLESVHGGDTSGNVTLVAIGSTSDIIANVDTDAVTVPRGNLSLTAGRDIAFGTIGTNFDNDVRASGSTTINAGRDFLIDGFADLTSDDFGLATGGNLVINAGRNIHMRNVAGDDASILANGNSGADVVMTTGFNGAVILDTPSGVGIDPLESNSGDIVVNADRMLINAASDMRADLGQVIIRPATEGREVFLGSAGDASLALELSDTELSRIFTPRLVLGGDAAGTVSVISSLSIANAPNVELRSGEDLFISANMTVTASLALRAGNNIFLTPSTINVPDFSAFADLAGDDAGEGGIINLNALVASTTSTLRGNAENDTIIGTSANEAIAGLEGNDNLQGNGGNDVINGGVGVDSMNGGLGDDQLFVDSAGDVVLEAIGEGTDRIFASSSYVLAAGIEVETLSTTANGGLTAINLTGNEIANTIFGNAGNNVLNGGGANDILSAFAGNDTLDGGTGVDNMFGGQGDDFYVVDELTDAVTEAVGDGNDRVFASVTYALGNLVSVETLSTTDSAGVTAINLVGNSFTNSLLGNNGNNILNGAAGVDTLRGFAGDDQYYVDNAGDVVFENAGAGTDRIFASASYAMAAGVFVETLSTTNNAGVGAINLTGNELANIIFGNAGANVLSGGGGNDSIDGLAGLDTLNGGTGDDQLFVDAAGDVVQEAVGEGNDRVFAGATYSLAAGVEVETLSTNNNAGTGAINLVGNNFGNTLIGNNGNNILNGATGNDNLQGLGGNDSLFVDSATDVVAEAVGGGTDRVFASVSYALTGGAEVETLSTTNNAGVTAINLLGNSFANSVIGNAGVNILNGGGGSDTLQGLGGADSFAFSNTPGPSNLDLVADFAPGVDAILLENSIFTGLAAGALPANAFATGAAAADADDRVIYDPATGALFFDVDGTGATAQVQFATLSTGLAVTAADFTVI